MEIRWRLLDEGHVKLRLNNHTLSTQELDALIRALGRLRVRMRPGVPLQPDYDAPVTGEAGIIASETDDGTVVAARHPGFGWLHFHMTGDGAGMAASAEIAQAPPATLDEALDAIEHLLMKSPAEDRDSIPGLLRTYARVGQIARQALAFVAERPAPNTISDTIPAAPGANSR